MKNKLFIIGGCSCSGKTVIARKICEENNFIFFGSDYILKNLKFSYGNDNDVVHLYNEMDILEIGAFEKSKKIIEIYKSMSEMIFDFLSAFRNTTIVAEGTFFLPEIIFKYNIPVDNYIALTINRSESFKIFKNRDYVKKHFNNKYMSFFEEMQYIDDSYRNQCAIFGYEYYNNTHIESTYDYILHKLLRSWE